MLRNLFCVVESIVLTLLVLLVGLFALPFLMGGCLPDWFNSFMTWCSKRLHRYEETKVSQALMSDSAPYASGIFATCGAALVAIIFLAHLAITHHI